LVRVIDIAKYPQPLSVFDPLPVGRADGNVFLNVLSAILNQKEVALVDSFTGIQRFHFAWKRFLPNGL
jgi:hypothetical protein